jgi:hypothetical protein
MRLSRKNKKNLKKQFGQDSYAELKKQNKKKLYLYSFGVHDPVKDFFWEETCVIDSDQISLKSENRFIKMSKEELCVFDHFANKHAKLGRRLMYIQKEA